MFESLESYLDRLKLEMKDCDSSLIQDALADAEEHLRIALDTAFRESGQTEREALAAVIQEYGTPEEIAGLYRETEADRMVFLSSIPSPRVPSFFLRFFGVLAEPRAWGAFLYALLIFITGQLYCYWALVGGGFAALSLIFIIGIPFAALYLLSLRGIALIEGRIVEALLDMRMPRKSLFMDRGQKWTRLLKALYTESQTWKALLYMLLQLPLGLLYFLVIGGLFILSLTFITSPILELVYHLPLEIMGTEKFTAVWLLPLVCLGGLFLLPLTLHLAKWIGKWHSRYAKSLLVRK